MCYNEVDNSDFLPRRFPAVLKLYLKKLFLIIAFSLSILGIYYICSPMLMSIANFFAHHAIQFTILMGIPTLLVFMFIYKKRVNNQSLRTDYVKYIRSLNTADLKLNIRNEINYFKTFKPLHAETLAITTLILPFAVGIGTTVENDASFLVNCFAGLVVFSLIVGVCFVLAVTFWLFVHRNWLKCL